MRDAGWAAVDQELEQGVRSAAVPIRDATGAVVAALNVSVHATRMTMQALRRQVVPKLLRTAEAIEVDLRAAGARIRLDTLGTEVESAGAVAG